MNENNLKYLAFYLPQFHRIPENDKWWGEGFTEWTNVKSAKPLFEGHNQPNIPHDDIGYYDLSDVNVMAKQAEIAKKYGIHGFCYYYYWFNGRRILEKPLFDMLNNKDVDIPFCLCWANHNWTKTWAANNKKILLGHKYPKGWYKRYIDDIVPFFKDERYIKIDGKCLMLIYSVVSIKNNASALKSMREYAKEKYGIDLYIVNIEFNDLSINPKTFGCDAAYEFTPSWAKDDKVLDNEIPKLYEDHPITYLDYRTKAIRSIMREDNEYEYYQGVNLGFDNSPRRQTRNPIVFSNFNADNFRIYLEEISKKAIKKNQEFVFMIAWNEWGETCYLEPDQRNGYKLLEVVAEVKNKSKEELLAVDNTKILYEWAKKYYYNIDSNVNIKNKTADYKKYVNDNNNSVGEKTVFRFTSKKLIKGHKMEVSCVKFGGGGG